MAKEVGKIYSAVDADELEVGDLVIVGNNLAYVRLYKIEKKIKIVYTIS